MRHAQVQELLPAYALDALTPDERRAVEAHVQGCEECRRDLAAFATVTARMADSVMMATPPAALRSRILEAVRAEPRVAEAPVAAPSPRSVPSRAVRAPSGWAFGLAIAAAVVAVVTGVLSVLLGQRLGALTAQLTRMDQQVTVLTNRLAQQEQLFAVVVNPAAKRATLAGAVLGDVQFVYDPSSRQGALIVRSLADPQQGFVYQLWLVARSGPPQSAGVFRPATGRSLVVPVAADFSRYTAVAISVERGPDGAPQPTATPILSATL